MGIKARRKPSEFKRDQRPGGLVSDRSRNAPKSEKVASAVPAREHRERLLRKFDATGSERIVVLFSDRKYAGQLFEGDITFLNAAPNLADAFVEAVHATFSSGMTRKAVTNAIGEMRNGFVNFLESTSKLDIRIGELDTKCVNAFVQWLNQTDSSGAARWAEATRDGRYKRLVNLIEWLRHSKKWSVKLSPNLDLPINPWAGRSRRKIPLQVIDGDLMTRIRKACLCEVAGTM